jgi:hypothetical protein
MPRRVVNNIAKSFKLVGPAVLRWVENGVEHKDAVRIIP